MASEIQATDTPGLTTLYALLFNSVSQVWNGTAFVTPAASTRATYAITLTELDCDGVFVANFPATITTAGRYTYVVYARSGGSPADSDSRKGTGWVDWTGSAVQSPANLLDAVTVETGVNARQALSPILAASAGVLSGAGTGTITIKGGNVATTRVVATTDAVGNRTAIVLTLPT